MAAGTYILRQRHRTVEASLVPARPGWGVRAIGFDGKNQKGDQEHPRVVLRPQYAAVRRHLRLDSRVYFSGSERLFRIQARRQNRSLRHSFPTGDGPTGPSRSPEKGKLAQESIQG